VSIRSWSADWLTGRVVEGILEADVRETKFRRERHLVFV
jgi:hypothetical protein